MPPVPDLAIDLRPDVRFRRLARCGPACPPLSTVRSRPAVPGESSDAATDPPDVTAVDDGSSGRTATLALENTTDGPSTASVRATSAGDLVLDADYRVPATSRLDVRVPRRARYRVTVAVGGWPAASVARLAVDVADSEGPQFRCRGVYRDLVVESRDTSPRTVAVDVRAGGDVALRRRFELAAGASRRVPRGVPPGGRYDVVVETDEERHEADAWEVCPPLGPVRVIAVAGDGVRVSVRERRERATRFRSGTERVSADSVPGTRDPE